MNTTFGDSLRAALAALPHGNIEVQWYQSVESTNDTGLQRAFGAEPAGPVLIGADLQTRGHGRRGRGWVSAACAEQGLNSVTMSLVFERLVSRDSAVAGYSLVVGWALVQALCGPCPDLQVKWPNDVQKAGRKCAGILIETRRQGPIERVVVGIGLNLWVDAAAAQRVGQPMAGLFEAAPCAAVRAELIAHVALQQWRAWQRFCAAGFASFQADWAGVDALFGREVQVLGDPQDPSSVMYHGRALGVAADGALLLESPDGVVAVYAGEVSVRALA